jgi:DNA-binding SARP family transcriptional activator
MACVDDPASATQGVVRAALTDPASLSMIAEPVARRLAGLSAEARAHITSEVDRRPERWRDPLRMVVAGGDPGGRQAAADLLVRIGELSDVRLLRDRARTANHRSLATNARALARRLAPHVIVEDLGRVTIRVGQRVIEGSEIRRKVLALLCYVLTRPNHAASREEVVEALWPDQDPSAAMNSLNQTVYFLRRVFEPDYHEELSPGYIHQDGESLWLDTDLISSQSDRCRVLIRTSTRAGPLLVTELAEAYHGRFALDFQYEDWACQFRDALHGPYLRVMEHAIRRAVDSSDFDGGIALAERVRQVDPESEEIQLALIRLYRLSRAFAAAAEEYEHYAAGLRDLGLEPIPMAEL